jgi:hypothetical protein
LRYIVTGRNEKRKQQSSSAEMVRIPGEPGVGVDE